MRKANFFTWIIIFLLALLAPACSGSPAAAPTLSQGPSFAATTTEEILSPPDVAAQPTSTPDPPTAELPTDTAIPLETFSLTPEQPDTIPDKADSELQVVYTHENNLWLWKSDGTQTQLTDSYEAFAPKISPDGKLVAYLQGLDIYNAELWVMEIDGNKKRQLVGTDYLAALPREADAVGTMIGEFTWVPGSLTLAYNTIQLFEIPSSPQNNDLRLVDANTGAKTLLQEPGQGGKFTYSPDGSQIALVTPNSLSLTNADGSNRRDILTFPVIYTNGGWNYYPQPVWAPDSGHLRVAIPPQDALNNPQAFTFIWHIPADGSIPHMAGEFVAIPAYVSAPLISPDTQKVIYLYAVGEALDQLELRLLDLTDGSQSALYTGSITLHNWNPDSDRFVFAQNFGTDFYIGQLGVPFDAIADASVRQNLEWISPDQFIFTSGDYENRELRIEVLNEPSTVIAQPFGESFTFDFHPKP